MHKLAELEDQFAELQSNTSSPKKQLDEFEEQNDDSVFSSLFKFILLSIK